MLKNVKLLVAIFLSTGAMIYLSTSHANIPINGIDMQVRNEPATKCGFVNKQAPLKDIKGLSQAAQE